MSDETRRCAVCGIPLRPSQSAAATCASLSCHRIHKLRTPANFGRRCRFCARQASASEPTCDDARCRRLQAGWIDVRKAEAERRVAVDRVMREEERGMRETHGSAIPERVILAPLPANEQTTARLPDTRRATFAENLAAALDRAMQDPDRPVVESPETPAARAGLIGAACAACRGSCCRYGHDHAFLYPDHFRRYLRDHPGTSREKLLEAYRSHLPAEVYHDSCVYHTTSGCALP